MIRILPLILVTVFLNCAAATAMAQSWQVGLARRDITPEGPIRLSGYASRDDSSTGVADPLHVRAMVLAPGTDRQESEAAISRESLVLVSVDGIMVSSSMSVEVARWLDERYSIPRSQIALCSTHSHAAPHIDGGLTNLYRKPSSEQQRKAIEDYTARLLEAIKLVIEEAGERLQPASLSIGDGNATFAVNRRVIRDGTWTGFGEQAGGLVDHRVRVLRITDPEGQLLGGAFLYACHCTTLGGDFNQVSGDWAGLGASRLEAIHPGGVFLPVIGCGADANPNPRSTYELAQQHAAELVDAVQTVLVGGQSQTLEDFPVAHFGYAGLAPERPTDQRIEELAKSERPNEQRWAEHMKSVRSEMGRLPESYPMPIHTWQFGDELTWVFLGGEVVVEYQIQIEKELPTKETWVAAYSDDVFAYVASEAMRPEGGYEVDFSMIYYLQPGRWQTGTQAQIIRRVAEIRRGEGIEVSGLPPDRALGAIHVADGYQVDLVAAEPWVQDPINIAFGYDGNVWVVEMADYPSGTKGGGRVKRLSDTDGNGRLDQSVTFLQGLEYPTSVQPWGDGVLVIAAPDVIYAEDTTGDGVADMQEVWLTGIAKANPQHRASGFEIGLDGWLHFAAGDDTEVLTTRSGNQVELHRNDVAWNPRTDQLRATSGATQFCRSRDAFGNWFGNSNSRPMYHYVLEADDVRGKAVSGGASSNLLRPAIAPPVFPASLTAGRFNDLYAFNRFTSACSSIVVRSESFQAGEKAHGQLTGLICEPVHNLVARIRIEQDAATYTAKRFHPEAKVDFFASSDPWSRPVRVVNAPDGSVWVVDMMRKVIEHPEWIPTSWQSRLDVRAGSGMGRIYRISPSESKQVAWAHIEDAADAVQALCAAEGAVRDLGLLYLVSRASPTEYPTIAEALRRQGQVETQGPEVRAALFGALAAIGELNESDVVLGLGDSDARVVAATLRLLRRSDLDLTHVENAFAMVAQQELGMAVDLQWLLTAARFNSVDLELFRDVVRRGAKDSWLLKTIGSASSSELAVASVEALLTFTDQESDVDLKALGATMSKLIAKCDRLAVKRLASRLGDGEEPKMTASQLLLLVSFARAGTLELMNKQTLARYQGMMHRRLLAAKSPLSERMQLIQALGQGLAPVEEEVNLVSELLENGTSPEVRQAALRAMASLAHPRTSQIILGQWKTMPRIERTVACSTLMSRSEWVFALVDQLESGAITASELEPATIQQLRSYPNRSLRTRCLAVFGKPTERSKVVGRYLSEIPSPQEIEGDESLFKTHCAACHQTAEGKPAIGPPLENLKHWTVEQWVTAILDPNRNVEPKFMQSTVLTEDDQVLGGIIVEQNRDSVQVALADGSIRQLARDEIVSIQESKTSLMPAGLEAKLTPLQLSQLIAWLRSR